MKRRKKRDCSI